MNWTTDISEIFFFFFLIETAHLVLRNSTGSDNDLQHAEMCTLATIDILFCATNNRFFVVDKIGGNYFLNENDCVLFTKVFEIFVIKQLYRACYVLKFYRHFEFEIVILIKLEISLKMNTNSIYGMNNYVKN